MRDIKEIIIHCSATTEGRDFHATDIDRWHRERGFKEIGYHYVITLDGSVEKGRDEWQVGAHCRGHNAKSIGICYIGGLDKKLQPKDTRTEVQRKAMTKLIGELKQRYPEAGVYGHNDFDHSKLCPCYKVEN